MTTLGDLELSTLRAENYQGLARVPLQSLKFNHPLVQQKHREISEKNIQRLCNVFARSSCQRLQQENYINAIVGQSELVGSLAAIGMTPSQMLKLQEGDNLPYLSLDSVFCLSGLHRVEAAKRYLPSSDQWWVVRLYSGNSPKELLLRDIEAYTNEQRPPDGEVFRKIRIYHNCGDIESENRWWTYLDNSKPKDLRQLIKHKNLISAFDALVDIPGLWSKVHLGSLHRLLKLRCDEEMICYLSHVDTTWRKILSCNSGSLPASVVDSKTVEKLQLLRPCADSDKYIIQKLMKERVLFPNILDDSTRLRLLENICSLTCLIPSLWTFFENLKFLEPCCDSLRQILGNDIHGTLKSTLLSSYSPPAKSYIQTDANYEAEFDISAEPDALAQIAYLELWAFCARHLDGLTTFTPRKEAKKPKPLVKGPNPLLLQYLAKFAISRGFRTHRALLLSKQDSQTALAIDFLKKANPIASDYSIDQVRAVIDAGTRPPSTVQTLKSQSAISEITPERRCGRPFEDDYAVDKLTLFLPLIYGDYKSSDATLAFVRQDLFTHFFGPIRILDTQLGPSAQASWLQV
ncbi:uncharacterized protein EI97DRAFT_413974, partial [Westerdykella ornata]